MKNLGCILFASTLFVVGCGGGGEAQKGAAEQTSQDCVGANCNSLPPPPPPPAPVCGNGTMETGEACDSGSSNGLCPASCSNTCTLNSCDTLAPSVPKDLAATTTTTTVLLSWSASSDNVAVTGYRVFRDGVAISTTPLPGFADAGLTANTSYSYKIAAFDAAGNLSAQSSAFPAKTQALPPPPPPSPVCGNGTLETGEACDKGSSNGVCPATCSSTCSINTCDTQAPTVPTNLKAIPGTTTMALSWTASTDLVGVVGYNLYRDGALIASVSTTSFQDMGLASGTTYSYTVAAYDAAANTSPRSSSASAKTIVPPICGNGTVETGEVCDKGSANGMCPATCSSTCTVNTCDTKAPSVPTGLKLTVGGQTAIALTWTASTDLVGVKGYHVYRGGALVASPTSNSFSDTGLTPATSYTYNVDAFDAAGNTSAKSSAATATTLAPPICGNGKIETGETCDKGTANGLCPAACSSTCVPNTCDTQAPKAPTDLKGTAQSMSEILLRWTAATDNVGVVGYRIYRAGTLLSSTTDLSFQDTGLKANTSYSYSVSAYDAASNSSPKSSAVAVKTLPVPICGNGVKESGEACDSGGNNSKCPSTCSSTCTVNACDIQAPTAPTGLTATLIAPNTVKLTWNAATDNVGVSGYFISRNGIHSASATTTTHQESILASNTTYTYVVTAVDADGNISPPSNSASVTTPPQASDTAQVCSLWKKATSASGSPGWTGNTSTCKAGDISATYRQTVVDLISTYRAIAGLDPVRDDATLNNYAQECSLMIYANGQLNHQPPTSWRCYSAAGAQGAGGSNEATASALPAIDMYMVDSGNATTMGHRRWILSPGLGRVGVGSTSGPSCLYVFGGGASSTRTWVAWPPAGKVPIDMISRYSGNGWTIQSSFSLNNTTVTVTEGGKTLAMKVTQLLPAYGSTAAISLIPQGWSPAANKTYHVKVTGASTPIEYDMEVVTCQ